MQRLALASLAVAVVSQSNDALSLLQTSVVKHNQSLLQEVFVASRYDEEGKKECRAAKQAFKELKSTMKADRQAVKDARAALKAAKAKRTETKKALKDARDAKEAACVKEGDENAEPVSGRKIRACTAHKMDDFPRQRIDLSGGLTDGSYDVGRAGEPCSAYAGPRDFLSGKPDCDLAYDVQDYMGVPPEAREEDCARGCGAVTRGSVNMGIDVPSADVCLQVAMGSPSCRGMKSITWINSYGNSVKGQCFCTGGTKLVICGPRGAGSAEPCIDPNNFIDWEHPSYKTAYSLTCALPKSTAKDNLYSTYKPGSGGQSNWREKIPVCNGGAGIQAVQDHAAKSIVVGSFGTDIKGRAACADQSWKDKKCREIATRLSFHSQSGECRCEWGPTLISDQMWRWKLNGAGTKFPSDPSAYAEQLKWTTCLYPRDFLKQGKEGEAFAVKYWR